MFPKIGGMDTYYILSLAFFVLYWTIRKIGFVSNKEMERERIEEQAENIERILRGGRDKDPKRVAAGKRLAKWNKEERESTPPQYFVVFGVVVYFLYIYFRG